MPNIVLHYHGSLQSGRANLEEIVGAHQTGDTLHACGPASLLQGLAEAGAGRADRAMPCAWKVSAPAHRPAMQRGECGQCYATVLEGDVLHRDVCLTPAMRATGMCTCVSWAGKPGRPVLEL